MSEFADGTCEGGLMMEGGTPEAAPGGGRTTPPGDAPGLATLPGEEPLAPEAKCGGFSDTGVNGFFAFA